MKTTRYFLLLHRLLPVLALAGMMLLTACTTAATSAPKATTVPAGVQSTQQTAEPAPSAIIAPSPTMPPGKVWLISAEDKPALLSVLTDLAEENGWQLEVRPSLQPDELLPEVRVVVWSQPPANLNELQVSGGQTQWIVFSPVDLAPSANLSVIRLRQENQAFVAGHLASLYASDWRAGGLLPSDGVLGMQLQEAFVNGARYFCGMCAPGWPLGMLYPQVGALPAASDGAAWLTAAQTLFDVNKVNLFFVADEAARPEVYNYLQGLEQFGVPVRLVGVQSPPPEVAEQWLATVRFDSAAALRAVWPKVAAGEGGQVMDAALVLDDLPDEDDPTAGRLRLVEEVIHEIAAGRIYPLLIPPE